MDALRNQGGGRSIQCVLYGVAAMPFVLSMVFHAIGATPQTPTRPVVRPALTFDQYLVHLGNAPLRQMQVARFRFTNRSERTVTIRELKPSCGCLNPKLERKVYQPQESGEFYLRLQTATERPGPNEYYCDVSYEDGQQRVTRVTFKVNLPEKTVVVHPPALIFYQRNQETTTHVITVTDFRSRRLELVGVECTSDLVEVALGEGAFDAEGNRVQKVFVKVGSIPPGRHHATVRMTTDDREFSELKVPLLLEGPVVAAGRMAAEQDHEHSRIRH